jgi:glycine dehydrogenase subunit 2
MADKILEYLIFELDGLGESTYEVDDPIGDDFSVDVPQELVRDDLPFPDVPEVEVVRHYTRLSQLNFSVDTGFYPLGSCTMKYNPKIHEHVASDARFAMLHPYQPDEDVQGALAVMYHLSELLQEITGMDAISLHPAAGAHGELTGTFIARAYFRQKGETGRHIAIIPDSAHGTNPASAAMAGFDVIEVKSNEKGQVDMDALREIVDKYGDEIAIIMLTNPNTLGVFEENILEIAELIHGVGGLLYYDGANLNGILGMARPGDMGFDIVHLNLHKTFSAPHGGGGPGSGPIGVKGHLKDFLPVPTVVYDEESGMFRLNYDIPHSIGRMRMFHANFLVLLKAYMYIISLGGEGLRQVGRLAVLNANYLAAKVKKYFPIPYGELYKHEFVATGKVLKEQGVKTLDIAKRLIDFGVHPPTIYFPLIVSEALMIEPTETEVKYNLDMYAAALETIYKEAHENPDILHSAPNNAPIGRLDDVKAVKQLKVVYTEEE